MKELKPRIHENGMDYVLVGDYYVPDLKLPEERRPIGHWGRLHQSYLKLHRPMLYNELILILSILVDTFISKISFPMQPGPEIGSISDA